MTPEELDKLATEQTPKPLPLPPPPADPTPQPKNTEQGLAGVRDVLATMREIDQMKYAFMESEMKRQEMMEKRIRDSIVESMQNNKPEENPLVAKAAEHLFGLAAAWMQGKPPAPAPTEIVQQMQKGAPTEATATTTAVAPKNEVEEMKNQALIERIGDAIEEAAPQQVKDLREGKITDEEAIKRVQDGLSLQNLQSLHSYAPAIVKYLKDGEE